MNIDSKKGYLFPRRKSTANIDFLNPLEEEIQKISKELSRKKKGAEFDNNKLLRLVDEDMQKIQNLINEYNLPLDYENKISVLDLICYILKKNTKKIIENEILKTYFIKNEKLVALFKPLNISLNDMFSKLVGHIKYEKKLKDNILFKEGDKGDKFYIILKGEVGILIQQEKIATCSFLEFIKCLMILYLYQEKSLVNKMIMNNRDLLKFDERSFATYMDAFKYYNFYKEYTYLKKQYKDIIEFTCAEKDIDKYIYKKNDCSMHECFGNLRISNHNIDKMYKFYLRMITEIKNNFSNEVGDVDAISKLKTGLNNNPNNIVELGLIIKSRQYDINRLKSLEFLEKINNTNEISNNMIYSCSVSNYKKRLCFEGVIEIVREDAKNYFPIYDDMDNFKYYNYNEINHLKDGNIFGELALINPSKKRTATIIIKEDCHLGILNKEIYDLSIKSAQHKLRIRSLIYFLQGPIFNGVSNNFFVNNYFFRFHKKVFNCGEVLFHRGEPRTKIFFIIRGELQLRSKMSLKKISQVIEYLNDGRDSDDGGLTKKYCRENIEFRQFYEQAKKLLKIYVLKDKEISGLDDMVENEIYLFDCVSVSSDGSEVYELDYKIYEEALRERVVRENNDEYVLKKKEILIHRLYKQRDSIAKNEYERIKAFSLNPNLNPNNKEKEKTLEYNSNLKSMNYFISLSSTYCNNMSTKLGPSIFEESQLGNNNITNTSVFQSRMLPNINKRNLTLTSYTEVNRNKSNKKQNQYQYQILKTESNEANSIFSMKETKKPVKLKESSVMTKGRSLAYLPSNIETNFRNDNNINSINNISRIASYVNNNNMKKEYFSLPKNNHKLVRPIQDKLLKSQMKKMKKKITTPNLLMKEFTKKYIEPNIVPCKKGKFKFDNQKIFEPLLNNKRIEIDQNKFINIAIKQSLKFNQSKNNENNKENSNQKIKINNGIKINDLDFEYPASSNRGKKFNISSVRNKKMVDNILDEKFKNYFFIDCLCLDKWEESKNKHLKKAASKLKGKKL